MSARWRRPGELAALLAGALASLALGVLALRESDVRIPDLAVRTLPRDLLLGRLQPGLPIGEAFLAAAPGLRHLEIPYLRVGERPPTGHVDRAHLRLWREDESGTPGPVLREAWCAAPRSPYASLSFAFEPIPDSAGGRFAFSVELLGSEATGIALFARPRRQLGARSNPARGAEACERVGAEMLSPDARLSGLGLAVARLVPGAGPLRLRLRVAPDGPIVREAELVLEAPVLDGWVYFSFEPIAESRWKTYRLEIDLPPGSEVLGKSDAAAWVGLHGVDEVSARLGGLRTGPRTETARDLVFSAWGEHDRPTLAEAERSLGKRLYLAALAGAASAGLALMGLRRARSSAARP